MAGTGVSRNTPLLRSVMESYPDNTVRIPQAALKIAGKGKPVFPCKADKSPYTRRGFKDATTDPEQIDSWFTEWPGANIGIPTGKASGLLVIDLDTYKPGAMTLGKFEEKYGTISHTATVRTGSGGLQFYFLYPDGAEIPNNAGRLGPHVDARGEGGYVLAPPSVTTGRYEWINSAPPAPVPPKLLQALREDPRKPRKPSGPAAPRSRATIPDDGGAIPDGQRNMRLASIAGRLHDGTRDLAQLEDELHAINAARCVPPLPVDQVRKIARSISRYEPCRPARREPDADTVEALAAIERELLGREWKGQSGKTEYSISVAALKLARLHGELVEGGVRVSASARQLALAAAVSRRTIVRKLKAMGEILRHEPGDPESGKSGAIVLLLPRATCHHPNHRASYRGGCDNLRAPLTAPRLRWSSPPRRPRRGVTPGTSRVRQGVTPEKRAAVIRLGKSCERVMDVLEAAGGTMPLADLAAAVGVKRPRDLTRRKSMQTGGGRDGYLTRLEDVGVLTIRGDTVSLAEDWLEALDQERDRTGEIALFRRDLARYNHERAGWRNRHNVKADPAPSEEDMRAERESYPERRREAIEDAIARLFAERPEYRARRAGQVTCMLMFYLPDDFPRGPDGAPKDAEVEAILDGAAA